ncbi:hypothetical protein [Serratia ficaria]
MSISLIIGQAKSTNGTRPGAYACVENLQCRAVRRLVERNFKRLERQMLNVLCACDRGGRQATDIEVAIPAVDGLDG